jgi:hypothetical protein
LYNCRININRLIALFTSGPITQVLNSSSEKSTRQQQRFIGRDNLEIGSRKFESVFDRSRNISPLRRKD